MYSANAISGGDRFADRSRWDCILEGNRNCRKISIWYSIHWIARFTMTANTASTAYEVNTTAHAPQAGTGLAIVRVTIGAMLVWVFFENLGKGLYTPAGYASLINYYIKQSHSPAVWKAVMGLAASHAAMAAPLQAVTEISLGILLVIGLFTRPVALVTFAY